MLTPCEVPAGVGGTLDFTLCEAQNFTMAKAITSHRQSRCFTYTLAPQPLLCYNTLKGGDFMEIKAKCKYDLDSVKALTHLTMYKKADLRKRLIFWPACVYQHSKREKQIEYPTQTKNPFTKA